MGPSFPRGQWDNWSSLHKLALQGPHACSAPWAEQTQGPHLGGARMMYPYPQEAIVPPVLCILTKCWDHMFGPQGTGKLRPL
jgi:hypothetical protein